MSASATTSQRAVTKDLGCSEKFLKDLEKFTSWAVQNDYLIKNRLETSDQVDWKQGTSLLKMFKEPSRNKLEVFVSALMQDYVITHQDEPVDDYRSMVKQFKDDKPKRSRTSSSVNKVSVDFDLDTSETSYLETLDFNAAELQSKLGAPKLTGKSTDKHRFEWKIKIGDNIYSIYDWKNQSGEFDEVSITKWHIAGQETVVSKKNMGLLLDMLNVNNKTPMQDNDNVDAGDNNKGGKLTHDQLKNLFGEDYEDDDTESIDIDLNDL